MDIRTGKTYATEEEALAEALHPADVAHVQENVVRFKNGPFKDRTYVRNALGQLVNVDRAQERTSKKFVEQSEVKAGRR